MTIDDYIAKRNTIQLDAEMRGAGDAMWRRLGVANRHITRVLDGTLNLTPVVEREIVSCLEMASCLRRPIQGE